MAEHRRYRRGCEAEGISMIFIIGYLACCFALAALLLAMMGAVA